MKSSNFQIVLIIVFIVFTVLAVLMFSGFINIGGSKGDQAIVKDNVTVWGVLPSGPISSFLQGFNEKSLTLNISYIQKNPETMYQEYIEALANNQGPDLFILSNDLFWTFKGRLIETPFESYPLATFRNTFTSQAENYMTDKGILGFPLVVDPLVMYYNRTLLDQAGIATPPGYWDEFITLAPVLTKKTDTTALTQSALALGTYSNINNAKEILSAMIMQTGNPIMSSVGGQLRSLINQGDTESILRFYTEFSNPAKDAFSWSRSLLPSRESFLANSLAFYFGFGSELFNIQRQNSNLNFDVAELPQNRQKGTRATFGKMYFIGVSSRSFKPAAATSAISALSGASAALELAKALSLSPARRDLLASIPATPFYLGTFYKSALISKSWIDPKPTETDNIFKNMIENILSGRFVISQSIQNAQDQLNILVGGR
ncbi:MAG: Extracellular solute-binding protein family 1 [Candidatus Nomurabacteria bacterium GW2011_GWB1_37_5]|uniref:Extracellular solute-binding protein family 1 n=1 Tax=Candidatus Nomurabacteria bacterium GW2011_GWB1_37_5 TaxID=1618742 RepID=A0A0G0HAY0_9BACT|nr:MAG: Extracellular solute-binding protein family 1 [Candidatus Nomurabacteria bacterium GW2011_GWB1_37_5]